MFKDIKAFLSSFFKKGKNESPFKKYLGITIAFILALLIPVIIAILYINFSNPIANTKKADELSIIMFDNDGNTIASEKISADRIKDSKFINAIYTLINAKDAATKPESFEKEPTFNLSITTATQTQTYKCYFDKDSSTSFIEDGAGNFFTPRSAEYSTFLNSSFSQKVYPESSPPSLTIEKDVFVLPKSVNWSYKLINGSTQESTNFKTDTKITSYMINGAIDFMFSEAPLESNVKIVAEKGEVVFVGTLEDTADFTANDGDKFTVFISATWESDANRSAFGTQNYEFEIVCTKPSIIEATPQNAFGGTLIKISVSDVNNADTIVYTAKKEQNATDDFKALYDFIPTFKKEGQNAYAFLPVPNGISEGTFEFSISYGITKADFSISLAKRPVPTTVTLSKENLSFEITDKAKEAFTKLIKDISTDSNDTLLFTGSFLSPEEYGFTKSVEYNSDVSIDGKAPFRFFANSYSATGTALISVKSANIGTVRAVGYSEILGNYVAVDHGAGLYTWYCGLSDVGVFEGDILKGGQFIGFSGSTSPLCANGVNVFCTLYGSLINPSDVLGQKLV